MRAQFAALIALGPMPPDDDIDESTARAYVEAIDAMSEVIATSPPDAQEVLGLITVFPPDDSTALELAWPVLHAIEALPAWPIWEELDDRNWWVTLLRRRCERAGLHPPDGHPRAGDPGP